MCGQVPGSIMAGSSSMFSPLVSAYSGFLLPSKIPDGEVEAGGVANDENLRPPPWNCRITTCKSSRGAFAQAD